MALLRSSKGDVAAKTAAAADQAERLAAKLRPLAEDAKARVGPAVESTRGKVGPAYEKAKGKVGPAYDAAVDKIGPAYVATRERVGPTVEVARERLNDDVIPRVAGAIAVAAETMAERAGDLHDKAYEVSVAPAKKRRRTRRRRIVLIFAAGAATAAGISVLVKKNRSQHWDKFEQQADEWAKQAGSGEVVGGASDGGVGDVGGSTDASPTAGSLGGDGSLGETRGLGDVASDDSAGASPDEALSDATETAGDVTTPDDPESTTPVKPGPRRRSSSKPS